MAGDRQQMMKTALWYVTSPYAGLLQDLALYFLRKEVYKIHLIRTLTD